MAIEFVCPYCDAQIRVPDKAAGKSGKCPRCVRKLLVPKVSAPPAAVAASPVTVPSADVGLPDLGAPAPGLPPEDEGDIVFAEAPAEIGGVASAAVQPVPIMDLAALPQVSTGVGRKLKKRRRSLVWIIPVLFGLLLFGGLGLVYFPDLLPARVSGELTAAPVSFPSLEPVLIDRSLLGGTDDEAKAVLEELDKQPIPLISSLMQVQLKGSPQGLQVFVTAGADTTFYRVDLASNPSVQAWLKRHAAELEEVREKQLKRGGKTFIPVTKGVQSGEKPVLDLVGFRDSLALPALAGGLGGHVAARSKSQLFPCVYQQTDQALYFLLPPGLSEFQLEGRGVSGSYVSFPAKLAVRVSSDKATVGPRESAPANEGEQSEPAGEQKSEGEKKGESQAPAESPDGKSPNESATKSENTES